MKRRFIFIWIYLGACLFAQAHSGKARFHVLIDTDGAADDLRAVCMLLSNREVEVLSVTTSEGALTPASAAVKVTALLHRFHHEGIPVGTGRPLNIAPPAWRQQSENIFWGDAAHLSVSPQNAKDLILQTVKNEEERVIFICLGTLTNLNDALTAHPELKERIDRVIWYNSSAQPLKGANYEADPKSAEQALSSGIPFRIISANKQYSFAIDEDFLKTLPDTEYAAQILQTHRSDALKQAVASKHLQAWDDLTAVYLFAPELFDSVAVKPNISRHELATASSLEQARQTIVQIFTGKPDSESRVFYGFPENAGLYAKDIASAAPEIIARHGRSEWRAGVIANELHGHLGIYAIVGVKMGIRAREYFNIGIDDMTVTSFAGSRPPVSCMNDGLQVSTGATIGHGLIHISPEQNIRPEATFTFKNKTLRLKLKPEYAQQIRQDVSEGIRLYGDLTEDYWQYIRQLAIRYWLEFERGEMFERDVPLN